RPAGRRRRGVSADRGEVARLLGVAPLAFAVRRGRPVVGAASGAAGLRAGLRLAGVRLGGGVLPRFLLAAQRPARPGRIATAPPRLVAVRALSAAVSAALQPAAAGGAAAAAVARRPAGALRAGVGGRRAAAAVGGAVQAG